MLSLKKELVEVKSLFYMCVALALWGALVLPYLGVKGPAPVRLSHARAEMTQHG
jgi:hypothetical protein